MLSPNSFINAMLPTSGYFKSIPCPYFNTDTCDRPYCHFRHQKASRSDHKNRIPSYVSSKSRENATYEATQLTSAASTGKYVPTTKSDVVEYIPTTKSDSVEYKPTTKPKKSAYRAATLPRPHYQHAPFPTGPSTLVYKPTPISELNKRHAEPEKESQPATTDAVISAEFKVIGQCEATTSSNGIDEQTDGQEVESDSLAILSECDLELPVPEEEDGDDVVLADDEISESPADDDEQTSDFQTSEVDEGEVHKGEEKEDEEKKDEEKTSERPTPRTKNAVTREEYEEMVYLFGEASDDEIIDEESNRGDSDSEDVVEVPTQVPDQPVIDLTAETSSDEEKLNSELQARSSKGETSKIKSAKSDIKLEKPDKSKVSKDSKKVKTSKSKSSKHKSRKDKSHRKGTAEVPIIVSSEGDKEQCKELFAMFRGVTEEVNASATAGTSEKPAESVSDKAESSRKRKAREGAESISRHPVKKHAAMPSAQQVMQNRYEAMKQAELDRKKRKNAENSQEKVKSDYNTTPGVTSSRTYKGQGRTAHQATSDKAMVSLDRPRITGNSKSKVPAGIRQAKLNYIIEECLKLYTNKSDAFARAKSEEETACSRANTRAIYCSLVVNIIKKIRDEVGAQSSVRPHSKVSHESVIAGKGSSSFTVGLKRRTSSNLTKDDMFGELLFKKLRSYLLSEEQLMEHGFPRSDVGQPGHAVIHWSHHDKHPHNKGNIRTCRRCGKNFRLSNNGEYIYKEECVYHWGKPFNRRVHGTVDMLFSCCEGKPGAEGCTICNGHVHDSNKYEDLTGYMTTFAKKEKDYCGVFALDCEMVYTMRGLEIARVTVINDQLKVMLDSIIKPSSEIIDYNTRFSGLTAENFKNVDTTLKDVQAILLNMFQENTVLIGHSLNSDLVALKLIHDNIVDTSVVWPHKHGLPYKRALKNLMLEVLNKLIQESGSAGHDSSEDASACMQLMKWKVFQDYMKDNR